MMYDTHLNIAKCTGLNIIGVGILWGRLPGSLIQNVTLIPEFAMASAVIYYFTCRGSEYPDLDHPSGKAQHLNIVNHTIAKVLRGKHLKHRSSETHSMDKVLFKSIIAVLIMYFICRLLEIITFRYFYALVLLSTVEKYIPLIWLGLFCGALCHILADMMTMEGAYFLNFLPKFSFVFHSKHFKTGTESPWECFVNEVALIYMKIALGVVAVMALFPHRLFTLLIDKIK